MTRENVSSRQRALERRVLFCTRYFMRDSVQRDEGRRARAYSALFDAVQELEGCLGRSMTEEYR